MRAIFISYRRDDSEGYAGRLFQDLCERFGRDSVFMDVAGIEPGRDFRRVIEQQVASCGVLLAVIGKAWLSAADREGKRRLDDAYDFVRLETASALKRDIPVIPVLVQQAAMPRAEDLPDDLKDLAFRNSVELTHARWDSDVELLVAALKHHVDSSTPTASAAAPTAPRSTPSGRQTKVIVPLAVLALGGIGYAVWDGWKPGAVDARDTATATSAASTPAGMVASPTASGSEPALAPSAAPPMTRASAPLAAHGPGPLAEASVAQPAASPSLGSQMTPARRVDRPVVAKAPAPTVAEAPAPRARTTAAAPPTMASPSHPSTGVPVESLAAAPPAITAPATLVPVPADSPIRPAAPDRRDPALDLLGGPGAASMITRTIVIKPETRYVNVTGGEIIRFEVGDKSFVWNFSGQRSSFDLARIAPPSVLDHKVTAYVAPNPMYLPRR